MIIINQDKTVIVNFDNINFIVKNDNEPIIYAKTKNEEIKLGEYATEERAKEVLNSIAEFYSREDYGENKFDPTAAIGLILSRQQAKYIMPGY